MKLDEAAIFRTIHPRHGRQVKHWGPRMADIIDRLTMQGLIDWASSDERKIFLRRDITPRFWWFGGMTLTLTEKGKIVRKKFVCR